MTASANIKTPTMDIPILSGQKFLKKAKRLQKKLTKVYLAQVRQDAQKCYLTHPCLLQREDIGTTQILKGNLNSKYIFKIQKM